MLSCVRTRPGVQACQHCVCGGAQQDLALVSSKESFTSCESF